MQVRSATVQIDADDVLPFGRWNDVYVQFKEDGTLAIVEPEELVEAYIEGGAKVPVEFGEVRLIVEDRIAQLQALL